MTTQKRHSFTDVVWEKYGAKIEKAAAGYVAENFRQLGLQTHRGDEPDEAHMAHLSLRRIIPYDTPGDRVDFDAVAAAYIEVYKTSRSHAVKREFKQWLRVACSVELDGGLRDFRIVNTGIYNHGENRAAGTLTDTLVPYICADRLDAAADAITARYYPEALLEPTPIDVRRFAENMGLTIREICLSRSSAVFGQMVFNDCTVEYYDMDTRRYDTLEAARGTVLVDSEIYFLRTLGSWNNTVIHECVHWEQHRKAFGLERLHGENADAIRCQSAEKTAQTRTGADWMEWQANALAPRVLMPRGAFKRKAAEIAARHMAKTQTAKIADVIREVIFELHEFFGVSIQSAKIRMIDIGYTSAIGVFEYVDDRYLPAYSFGDGAAGRNRTFSIPVAASNRQYAANPGFRRLIDSGGFVYINAHYCINAPEYVAANGYGVLEMTEYATQNMDECCLAFERLTRPNDDFGVRGYTEHALFHNAVSQTVTAHEYSRNEQNRAVEARAAALLAERDEVRAAVKVMEKLPATFHKSLVKLMEWRGVTNEQLAASALLSAKTIQRLRAQAERKCEMQTLVAVCIGLHLPPYMSMPLIEKAGLKIKVGKKSMTYAHLLSAHFRGTVYEANEYLEAAGYPPLSGRE